jgi:hypothetical protein
LPQLQKLIAGMIMMMVTKMMQVQMVMEKLKRKVEKIMYPGLIPRWISLLQKYITTSLGGYLYFGCL